MEDIKRVLAYSTISQLGFMVAALGVGGYTAAMFHLITHTVFQGAAVPGVRFRHPRHGHAEHARDGRAVQEAAHYRLDVAHRRGGADRHPSLSGFFSKEEILIDALRRQPGHFLGAGRGGCSDGLLHDPATYLTFFGTPRDRAAYEKAHEGGMVMTYPLIILGALAAVTGFLAGPFADLVYYGHPHRAEFNTFVFGVATVVWVAGVLLALAIYKFNLVSRRRLIQAFYPIWMLLKRRYYIDDLYNLVFVRGTIGLAMVMAWIDRTIVDGIVNGVAWATRKLSGFIGEFDLGVVDGAVNGIAGAFVVGSRLFRRVQTGLFQSYALVLFLGLVAGLVILVIGG